MIFINLTPEDEIRSKTWFVPDLLFACMLVGAIWAYAGFELEILRSDINFTLTKTKRADKELKELSEESKKYYTLNARIQTINNKILAINTLTSNLLRHYRPLLLIEKIQQARPESLWLYSLEHDHANSIIKLSGGALHSSDVANFIQELKKPASNRNGNKLYTQIQFSKTALEKISKSNSSAKLSTEKKVDAALIEVITNKKHNKEDPLRKFISSTSASFSDIKGYPEFKLNLMYEEAKKTI